MAKHWIKLHYEFKTTESFQRSCYTVLNNNSNDNDSSITSASSLQPNLIVFQNKNNQQENANFNRFVTSNQVNTFATNSKTCASLNNFNYPPPITPIININSIQQLNNLNDVASLSQHQQQHIYNYYSLNTHNQNLLNGSNQMQKHLNSSQVIPFIPNLPHQSPFMSFTSPHLSTVPPILPLPVSIQQNHLTYSNANPQSPSQFLNTNIQSQYYLSQQQFNLVENNSKLHISHSAPNLQKNGSFIPTPLSINATNLPIFYQIQPQLQNTLQQQTLQNINSNYDSVQNYLPLPISK